MKRTRLPKSGFHIHDRGRLAGISAFIESKDHDIQRFIVHAEREIAMFDKTKDITYLQEAGNKLYNAHIHFIEKSVGKDLRDNRSVREEGRRLADVSPVFRQVYQNVLSFHRWFYEGIEDSVYVRNMMIETIHYLKGLQVGGRK
jgi:hypothetical protein